MKRNISIYFLTTFLLLSFFGCRKVENEPKDWIKEDLVWDEMDKNATLAQFFLNDVYNYLPGGFNRISLDYLDAATDDALPSRNNTVVQNYTNGLITSTNNPDPYWSNSYYGIRRANIFLANIHKVPTTAQNMQFWRAEARFIRAQLYFELLKRYGGIPLVGDKIFTIDDDLEIPRNSFEETVNYIVNECNAIKDSLRKEPVPDSDWGRVPRGAALALKLRVLLYAASPLFNGGGIETDPMKKMLTGYPGYDASRWQKVIDAADSIRALNYYQLHTSFMGLFTTKKNLEVILAKQAANSTNIEAANAPVGYSAPAASQGRTSATQNLVDAFTMDNGLPITDPASGYNPASPYTGRDSRFHATVFYNGVRWLSRNVETFEGGKDKPGGNVVQTKTGYYVRKFMGDFTNNTTYTNQSHNFILYRYAEVLLSLAEALNEVGRVEDAVAQVIAVRRRAAIRPGTNNRYGIKAGISQSEMRDLIRNERRVELAFEEHRFWDVRRWKIAEQVLQGPLFGMRITRNANGTFSYERVQVANIVFRPRLYHMPIPYDETTKNTKLIQNEGW
jgi:hypothetical protein